MIGAEFSLLLRQCPIERFPVCHSLSGKLYGFYYKSNSRECMGVNGEALSRMQFIKSSIFYCKSCENPYQYYKSRENLYQILQVTRAASECAMKSKVRMIKSLSP